jgi:hypothetical protein
MEQFYPLGKQAIGDGSNDWDTDTHGFVLFNGGTADTFLKLITAMTNATPIVVTSNSHGFANGDIVAIYGVGGLTAANNTWKIANVAANTFELKRLDDGTTNSTGNAAYTSGGFAVNLTQAKFRGDIDAGQIGTPVAFVNNGGKLVTVTGAWDADDVILTSVPSGTAYFGSVYKNNGSAATDRLLIHKDGRTPVVVHVAPSGTYTSVVVEPLKHAISNAAVLVFSNGSSVTLNAAASAGDRTITVVSTSVALTVGSRAEAVINTGSGNYPLATTGNNVNVTWPGTPDFIGVP